jgi:hypothetical protein
MRANRLPTVLSLVVWSVTVLVAQTPSPKEFLGNEVGADRYLCNYTDMIRYFRAVEASSPRVRLREIGVTGYGQPMQMAVITSPRNHERIERLREIARRLCRARDVEEAVARELCAEGCAVVWIDAGLHASEVIAGQNIIELVWQMASRTDEEVQRILDNVVLLACPVNPDGYELTANAYAATGSTRTPVLYQRYVGHDNNRDYYAVNTVETKNVCRVFFDEWNPQIVYNHHQTAPSGTIIYTPPFRDPFNYHADPNVVRGIEIVSAHMNSRFAAEGKPGVISRSGAPYSTWWNGGLRTTCYFHNIIGILTESFGRPEPTRIRQPLDRRLPSSDYPDPVPDQIWHARQTIEYLQTANFAILDYAARYRRELQFGIWRMGRNSIERGSRDHWTPTPRLVKLAAERGDAESVFTDPQLRDPRVYILPLDQTDIGSALRFVRSLQHNGIEVHRTIEDIEVAGRRCPAGSLVVRADQAFRAHVMDMFEAQWHPDDFRDGKPVPPYDSAGWTLAMQCGVEVVRSLDPVAGRFEPVSGLVLPTASTAAAGGRGWRLDPGNVDSYVLVNRLQGRGVAVRRAADGAFLVPPSADVTAASDGLAVCLEPVSESVEAGAAPLQAPRIGLFDVYGGHMATGWVQWILDEFEFPFERVWGQRITEGDLLADFDVLIFHTGLPGGRDLRRGRRDAGDWDFDAIAAAMPPFEDWSNLAARDVRLSGENSLDALRGFVAGGGTLVALGSEADKVIRHWELPVATGIRIEDPQAEDGHRRARNDEFYIPGSLVSLEVDAGHALAVGTPVETTAMFRRSLVFEVTGEGVDVLARYRAEDTLVSGWAVGQELLAGKVAALSADVGAGRLVLFGADVTYRGQPLGTFKMFFQSLIAAGGR